MTALLLVGDVHDRMAQLDDHSFDLIITSPPFLALRSYLPDDHPDKHLEIGSEATPAEYLDVLLSLTAEWRRLLAPHGSLAIELGDTYAGSGGAGGDYYFDGLREGQPGFDGSMNRGRKTGKYTNDTYAGVNAIPGERHSSIPSKGPGWPLDKSLCGIPTLYAWSLAYGRNLLTGQPSPAGQWRIRNLKPWIRTNPPVGALGDKERPATSYITVATLARDRWFDLDAVRLPHARPENATPEGSRTNTKRKPSGRLDGYGTQPGEAAMSNPGGAPPLDWYHTIDAIIDNELQQQPAVDTKEAVAAYERLIDYGINPAPVGESSVLGDPDSNRATDRTEPRRHDSPTPGFIDAIAQLHEVLYGSAWARNESPTVVWAELLRYIEYLNDRLLRAERHPIDAIIDDEINQRARNAGKPVSHSNRKTNDRDGHNGIDPGKVVHDTLQGARGWHIRRALERAGVLTTLDALDISPRGYSGAHYAVWPPELVRQLVDEMCPRKVCRECGEPSRRIVEIERLLDGQPTTTPTVPRRSGQATHGIDNNRITSNRETLGWSDCGHNTWRPGRILDPFVGSGTTLAVATGMARDAVGIDLDPRNAHLAEQRCGMFLTIDWGHLQPTDELPPAEIVAAVEGDML